MAAVSMPRARQANMEFDGRYHDLLNKYEDALKQIEILKEENKLIKQRINEIEREEENRFYHIRTPPAQCRRRKRIKEIILPWETKSNKAKHEETKHTDSPSKPPLREKKTNLGGSLHLNQFRDGERNLLQRRGSEAMFEVSVPNGTQPGQSFVAMADGEIVSVKCPANASAGQRLLFFKSSGGQLADDRRGHPKEERISSYTHASKLSFPSQTKKEEKLVSELVQLLWSQRFGERIELGE